MALALPLPCPYLLSLTLLMPTMHLALTGARLRMCILRAFSVLLVRGSLSVQLFLCDFVHNLFVFSLTSGELCDILLTPLEQSNAFTYE